MTVAPVRAYGSTDGGWVYIVTNKPHGVLYAGVTSDLPARIGQHQNATGSKFAARYNCTRLVYAEWHDRIEDAIEREKAIKEWPRLWKLRMIQEANPTWEEIVPWAD
jgi:putative endonuclease